MAVVTPPGTSLRQINETVGQDSQGNETRTVLFRDGFYGVLDAWRQTLTRGDTLQGEDGWLINSWRLTSNPGGSGTLEIELLPDGDAGGGGGGGQQAENQPLDETWQLKSCRNDMSILAYCGPDADSPCREWIEAWQKEPDGDLAKQGMFAKNDGSIVNIVDNPDEPGRSHATADLIAKMREGIESVMRFYPMLIKTRIYAKPPKTVFENLSCIDTPEITGATAKTFTAPGNLAEIIKDWVWLKCQDDTEKTSDGKHRRVEAWIGAKAWDENLYGTTNRWPMPYHYSS